MRTFIDENISDDDNCYEKSDLDDDVLMSRRRLTPFPIQLAPKHCNCVRCNWKGCEKPCEQKYLTVKDMEKYYSDKMLLQQENIKAEASKNMATMQAGFVSMMKEIDEKTQKMISQHHEFMASLPKESNATRTRRDLEKKKIFMKKIKAQQKIALAFSKKTTLVSKVVRKVQVVESMDEVETPEVIEVAIPEVIEVATPEVIQLATPEVIEVATPEVIEVASIESDWQEVKKKNMLKQQKNIVRTQICDSVFTGEKCRHEGKCRFAHNEKEFSVLDCFFGNKCINVIQQSDGVYTSAEGKFCKHKHLGETKTSVYFRVFKNIRSTKFAKQTEQLLLEPPLQQQHLEPPPQQPQSPLHAQPPLQQPQQPLQQPLQQQPLPLEHPLQPPQLKPPNASQQVVDDDSMLSQNPNREIVLLVPIELAAQSLEILIRSGKTNIQVKLV